MAFCEADGISLAAVLGEKRLELQRERSLQIEELSIFGVFEFNWVNRP